MTKTKIAKYIMSEAFHEDVRQALAEEVAKTRAAGLEPAGDVSARGESKTSKTVVIPSPRPAMRRRH